MLETLIGYALSSKTMQNIIYVERFQGEWETRSTLKPAFVKQLKQTSIITSSGASTRIEGAQIDDTQVASLLARNCKITKLSSRSEREVAGYVKCLKYIYKHYEDIPISETSIREMHQLLTSELTSAQLPKKQRGIYKDVPNDVIERNEMTGEERVWFQTTPPGPQTEAAMERIITGLKQIDTNHQVPQVLTIAGFIVHFLAIHPFRDGNGRLSRLLTLWLFLRAKYQWFQYISHEKVIEDNKEQYYVSLRNSQQTFKSRKINYHPWFDFFTNVLVKQTNLLKQKLKQEGPISELNSNETKVYNLVKEYGLCTSSFILEHVDLTRDGLKTLLQRLVERGTLERVGQKRATRYKISE